MYQSGSLVSDLSRQNCYGETRGYPRDWVASSDFLEFIGKNLCREEKNHRLRYSVTRPFFYPTVDQR